MFDFWKSVYGLLMIFAGVITFLWVTHKRIKGDKGGFGSHTKLYVGSIGLIIIGLTLLIRELMKME